MPAATIILLDGNYWIVRKLTWSSPILAEVNATVMPAIRVLLPDPVGPDRLGSPRLVALSIDGGPLLLTGRASIRESPKMKWERRARGRAAGPDFGLSRVKWRCGNGSPAHAPYSANAQ